jgi:hypothetical protein
MTPRITSTALCTTVWSAMREGAGKRSTRGGVEFQAGMQPVFGASLERDDFSLNRHPALAFCLSMIFSENRCTLFGIML